MPQRLFRSTRLTGDKEAPEREGNSFPDSAGQDKHSLGLGNTYLRERTSGRSGGEEERLLGGNTKQRRCGSKPGDGAASSSPDMAASRGEEHRYCVPRKGKIAGV